MRCANARLHSYNIKRAATIRSAQMGGCASNFVYLQMLNVIAFMQNIMPCFLQKRAEHYAYER